MFTISMWLYRLRLCLCFIVEPNRVFRDGPQDWSLRKTIGLVLKFQEKGSLENDKLIIEVYLDVLKSVAGEGINVSEKKEIVDYQQFSKTLREEKIWWCWWVSGPKTWITRHESWADGFRKLEVKGWRGFLREKESIWCLMCLGSITK